MPAEQFHIPGYEIRAPRDRNKCARGLVEYVKKGVTCKRNQKFDTLTHESVCSELTIAKKKWLCFSRCQPPLHENLPSLFEEVTGCLN